MATEVAETFESENFDTGTQFVENVAPVVAAELPDIKLFGRWNCDEVQVSDVSISIFKEKKILFHGTKLINSSLIRIILL